MRWVALAAHAFGDSPRRYQDRDFDTYMNDRLADGSNAVDDSQRTHLVPIEKALIKHGLMRYQPHADTIQSLREESSASVKAQP
jgi:hypothetical protein